MVQVSISTENVLKDRIGVIYSAAKNLAEKKMNELNGLSAAKSVLSEEKTQASQKEDWIQYDLVSGAIMIIEAMGQEIQTSKEVEEVGV